MNKNQLSKLIRFLFVEKKYGIKEINNNEIWLLKIGCDFPVVCVVLNERKDQNYYEKKYREFAMLLKSEQLLLLINSKNLNGKSYVYQESLENTFIQELFLRKSYQDNVPDIMLGILKYRFKSKFGFIRWLTLFIGFVSLIMLYLVFYVVGDQHQFLLGGYFRFAMLNWNEPYRFITMLFNTSNPFLLLVYLVILYYYEQVFTIEYSRKKFGLFIVLNTLISSFLLMVLNVEVIRSGLSSLVMSLSIITLIKFYYLWFKYTGLRKPFAYRFTLYHFVVLGFVLFNDMMAGIVGSIIGILGGFYVIAKDDLVLFKNYLISILILILSLGVISIKSFENKAINSEIKRQLKNGIIENKFYQYYQNKINKLEKHYEK